MYKGGKHLCQADDGCSRADAGCNEDDGLADERAVGPAVRV